MCSHRHHLCIAIHTIYSLLNLIMSLSSMSILYYIIQFEDYVAVANSCSNRANPMNCLDCRGRNGPDKTCNPESAHPVKYSCYEGQHFCCTVSNIIDTDFDDSDKYGQCKICAKDGEEVSMNLYKENGDQRDDSELQYSCCSGEISDVTMISGMGPMNEDGTVSSPFGTISGTCSETPGESIKLE